MSLPVMAGSRVTNFIALALLLCLSAGRTHKTELRRDAVQRHTNSDLDSAIKIKAGLCPLITSTDLQRHTIKPILLHRSLEPQRHLPPEDTKALRHMRKSAGSEESDLENGHDLEGRRIQFLPDILCSDVTRLCSKDQQCPGSDKCCLSVCGYVCSEPVGSDHEKNDRLMSMDKIQKIHKYFYGLP